MLLELHVKDIALIKKASVSFDGGLNIMTGETGTGKSVVIGSALLALGGRVKSGIIRQGAEYAYTELLFDPETEEKRQGLKNLGFEPDENGLYVISRKIMPGRSVSRINDEAVSTQRLREAAALLIDIYGQNEFHTLLDERKHLEILDDYLGASAASLKEETAAAYRRFKDAEKRLAGFTLNEREQRREKELAEFEISEIDKASLREGEEEELEKSYKRLNHAQKIGEALEGARSALEDSGVARALSFAQEAARYDEELQDIYGQLRDAESILSDAERDISSRLDELELDAGSFAAIEARLDRIRTLEARFGSSIAEVLAYRNEREARLEALEHYEEDRAACEKEVQETREVLLACCRRLSSVRREGALRMEKEMLKELKELSFSEGIGFRPDFQEKEPDASGFDRVSFMVALNPGEPLLPLSQAASGGELSRVMLAIKTLLARNDGIPTLIFDEIDAGISGRTAQRIAEKLNLISSNHQVICITHLPQIAAMADHHYLIEKNEEEGRNVTEIRKLKKEEEIEELARLLGGASITEAVYGNAGEMKRQAEELKENRHEKNTAVGI